MYKKILVPLDGSPLSEAVLPHAEELAKKDGAEIVILRVPEHIEPKFRAQAYAESIHAQEDADKAAEAYVHDKAALLQQENIKARGIAREGPVTETILAVAEETHADAIAMSTHGWKGLQHLLKGSVAEKIVQNAHIPVIVIHPN
jgi:nucleotide-binding universal stress UspA family protein